MCLLIGPMLYGAVEIFWHFAIIFDMYKICDNFLSLLSLLFSSSCLLLASQQTLLLKNCQWIDVEVMLLLNKLARDEFLPLSLNGNLNWVVRNQRADDVLYEEYTILK